MDESNAVRYSGDAQHYLPASLIGRFGERTAKQWRTARIAVRAVGSSSIGFTTARRVAFELALYRLMNPAAGLDPDAVDRVWTILEQRLPRAIERLFNGTLLSGDAETLLFYVASCAVRHPDVFRKIAGPHLSQIGVPEPTSDDLQVLRLQSVLATLDQIRPWRWRVFRCSPDAERLVLNDKGFCYLGDTTRNTTGLFLPLLPNLGIFGSLGDPEALFIASRILTAASVVFVNHILWLEAPREIYGHPTVGDAMLGLERVPPVNRLGPFMRRHGGGWFD